MNLLSANDFDALGNAMKRGEELFLWRTLKDVTVRAKTLRVAEPWEEDMILQVQMEKGHIIWTQNFGSTREAREQMDRWNRRFRWIV